MSPGTWIMAKYGGRFHLGTLIINVTGSFLIGVLMTVVDRTLVLSSCRAASKATDIPP
jgi:fluoride ion exporter CrcB/FEX